MLWVPLAKELCLLEHLALQSEFGSQVPDLPQDLEDLALPVDLGLQWGSVMLEVVDRSKTDPPSPLLSPPSLSFNYS